MSENIIFQIITTVGLLIPISTLIWNMAKLAAQVRENSKDIEGIRAIKEEFIVLKSEHETVLKHLEELKRTQAAISDKLTQIEINLVRLQMEILKGKERGGTE
jgi:cell division protein FtsB